jgi:hypothetical protein
MAAGEKEGKNLGREGRGRIWEGDARREEGGERRKKQATFVRSGRGPGDHVHFF